MTASRKLAAVAVIAVLLLTAVGCSSDGSDGADEGTKPTADATTTAPEPTGDGGPANTVPESEGVALPDGFPSELAPPAGVVTVTQADAIGEGGFVVVAQAAGADLQDLFDGLLAQLEGADYDIVSSSYTPDAASGGGYGSISARGSAYTAAIAIGPDDTTATDDVFLISMNIAPAT